MRVKAQPSQQHLNKVTQWRSPPLARAVPALLVGKAAAAAMVAAAQAVVKVAPAVEKGAPVQRAPRACSVKAVAPGEPAVPIARAIRARAVALSAHHAKPALAKKVTVAAE